MKEKKNRSKLLTMVTVFDSDSDTYLKNFDMDVWVDNYLVNKYFFQLLEKENDLVVLKVT